MYRKVPFDAEGVGSGNDANAIQAVVISSLELSGFCAQKKLTFLHGAHCLQLLLTELHTDLEAKQQGNWPAVHHTWGCATDRTCSS